MIAPANQELAKEAGTRHVLLHLDLLPCAQAQPPGKRALGGRCEDVYTLRPPFMKGFVCSLRACLVMLLTKPPTFPSFRLCLSFKPSPGEAPDE